MLTPGPLLDLLTRRLGGPRVLGLPFLRLLALLAAGAWVLLTPPAFPGWAAAAAVVAGFGVYSGVLFAALWLRPELVLGWNLGVLVVDLAFALAFIHLTGGMASTLYLALLLIVALQAYYYGMARGVGVAAVAAAAYLVVVWPTIDELQAGNAAIRLIVLAGMAVGVGVVANLEERERRKVGALSAEAQARERFIRGVVESLREGVLALDPEGRIVAWNRALEQRTGLAAGDVAGRRLADVLPDLARQPWAGDLEQVLRGERAELTAAAVEHDTPRGRLIQNVKASALREHGRPAGAVLLLEDVTDRVRLERSARQAEKLAALGTLAAGLAHELNNPIGVISSRIELMLLDAQARPLADEVREDLQVLQRHAQRVAHIAQGLLSFARQAPGQPGPVDLNRLVEETVLLVEKPIVKDGLVLRQRLAPDLPPVWGDANALQQVLVNLLTNARDALDGRGEIEISTGPSKAPPGVRLAVRDTGPGIPPEVVPRIFDPFFTTKPSGTGLGLSISYGIVREHQGTVDVQSAPGAGTTFVLTFPAAAPAPVSA